VCIVCSVYSVYSVYSESQGKQNCLAEIFLAENCVAENFLAENCLAENFLAENFLHIPIAFALFNHFLSAQASSTARSETHPLAGCPSSSSALLGCSTHGANIRLDSDGFSRRLTYAPPHVRTSSHTHLLIIAPPHIPIPGLSFKALSSPRLFCTRARYAAVGYTRWI
jgi:hypothetical protein